MRRSETVGWKVTVVAVMEPLCERYAVAVRDRRRVMELIQSRKAASVGELIEFDKDLTDADLADMGLKQGQYCEIKSTWQ
jgi:hypothetical protein